MEFMERKDHFLELNDGAIPIKHHTIFGHVRGHRIRVDIDPMTKVETATIIRVRNLIEVEKSTGKIMSIKRNFEPRREILGAETHADPSFAYMVVEAVDYPSDMQNRDGKIQYDYDKVRQSLRRNAL